MAELIFHNGNILSFHAAAPTGAQAIAVRGGKILAVGSREEVFRCQQNGTQCIDLQGKTLLPGFSDAHIHIWKVGNLLTHTLDLRGAKSIPEIQEKLRRFRAERPHARWLSARGFNEISMAEGRLPTRHDLDAAVPDLPVFLQRTCAHIAVVNTKTLEISDLSAKTPDPAGGQIDRDAGGNPTGILRETAQGLALRALPQHSPAELREMILAAQDALLAVGITSATDPAITPDLFEAYQNMAAAGELKIRVRAFPIRLPDGGAVPLPLPPLVRGPFFTADTVKFFADGGLSGRTAALSRPYLDTETRQPSAEMGILRLDERQFFQLAHESAASGWGIATHAIGDRAIALVLRAYKKLRQKFPETPLRVEHLGLPTRRHLTDLQAFSIGVATQPVFLDELGGNFARYLDAAFLRRTYPVRSLLERGIATAFSSDAPVVRVFNPLQSVASATLRQSAAGVKIAPQEAISVAEGLRAFTIGAAQLSGEAAWSGAILPGFAADFAVFEQNPLETLAQDLPKIRVAQTWAAGRRVV